MHSSDVLQICGEALSRVRLSLSTVGIYLAMGLDSTHTKLVREYSCVETFEVKGSDLCFHFRVSTKPTFVVAKFSWFLLCATRRERVVSSSQSGHGRKQTVLPCKCGLPCSCYILAREHVSHRSAAASFWGDM